MTEKMQSDSGHSWPVMVNASEQVSVNGLVSDSGMIVGVGGVDGVDGVGGVDGVDGVEGVEGAGEFGNAVAGAVGNTDVRLGKWISGDLQGSLWSFTGTSHWLTTRDPVTHVFNKIRVESLDHAKELAKDFANRGFDVYYSVSEFTANAQTRKAQDVACVRAFWLDLDVGAAKAEKGQGYATLEEAKAAVKAFRLKAGLPRPTHVVISGGGLHVYWVISDPISPEQWLVYAKMFKALTKALGLLADSTRTADIASLMRFPGTFNFKDAANPRAVELIYTSEKLIEVAVMLKAIEAAHVTHCGQVIPQVAPAVKMQVSQGSTTGVLPKQWVIFPAELSKLTSALCIFNPDVEESAWSLHRIAPIARAARENPALALDLYMLARHWSSGALRGLPSRAWTTLGRNGLTGEQYFDILWKRFLTDNYVGGRTLASIYFEAKAMGWTA